jgi:hypothetical protein
MRIAIIPPVSLLDSYGTMGDEYHLCLSDQVLKDDNYANFYEFRGTQGDYVILDNSAHEQLEGQTVDQLLLAARKIRPNEVVLPDRLFFGEDTLERSMEASIRFRRETPEIKQMGVPQGRTSQEWLNCLVGLKDIGVDTIGVSKDYETWDGGLFRLVSLVQSLGFSPKQIHLLGWGRELDQLDVLADEVRGVDSAKPLVYALSGVELPCPITRDNVPTYPRRRSNYFYEEGPFDDTFFQRATHNIGVFRFHARGGAWPLNPVRSLTDSWFREPERTH